MSKRDKPIRMPHGGEVKPEPTPAQKQKLAEIRKEFGKSMHGSYRIDRSTNVMRVRLQAQAGTWTWSFDRNGRMVQSYLDMQMTLEGENADTARSGALPKNAQDDNDT